MKKICMMVTVGALAMGLATSALAQAAGPRNGAPGQGQGQKQGPGALQDRAKAMQKINQAILEKLDLTAKQKRQIEALQTKQQAEIEKLREKAKGGDRAGIREEVAKLRKESQEALKEILTEKQQKQYQELLRAAIEKLRKDGGGADGKGGITDRAAGKAGKGGKGGGGF